MEKKKIHKHKFIEEKYYIDRVKKSIAYVGKPYASICKTCLYGYWILFCLWLPFVYNSIYYDFLRGKLNFVWKDDFGINLMNLRVWKLGCAWYKLCHLNVTFWITFLRCLIWLLSLIIKLWKHNDDTGQKFSSFPWTSLSFVLLCSFEDHKFRSLMPLNFLMYFMLRALLCK